MTTLKRTALLLALGACLAAAGCGSDDKEGAPIPADVAAALERELQSVQNRLDEGSVGACEDVLTNAESANQPAVQNLIDQLPGDVDPELRDALVQSFDNLWALVEQKCADRAADAPTEAQPDPEPETTPTEPETTPTEPEEEPTEPDDEVLPPDGDGDTPPDEVPGNGNGGGFGPSGAKEKKEK